MILDVQNICIQRQQQPIISQLSFRLAEQEKAFLQGEIGSGKSSLLFALMGFLPIQTGTIHWFGNLCQQEKDFKPLRGNQIGLCFQQAENQLFGPTVLDDVAFGPINQGFSNQQAYQKALTELERLEIAHLKHRSVHQLSGGEKNFTALAGVLAMQPKVLLLDEPTNGLDNKNQQRLISVLQQLNLPMLIASHDLNFSQQLADKVICLEKTIGNFS